MPFSKNKELTRGALLCALSVIIFSSFPIPLIGNILSAFSAIPFILIAYKNNLKFSIVSILVSTLLVSQLFGPAGAIIFLCFFSVIGVILGTVLKKGIEPALTIFITSIFSVIFFWASISLITNLSDIRFPIQEINNTFEAQLQASKAKALSTIKSDSDKKKLEEFYKDFFAKIPLYIKNFLPSLFIFTCTITTILNYALASLIFFKYFKIRIKPFHQYRFSWLFGIPVILSLVFYEFCSISFNASLSNHPDGVLGTLFFISLNVIATTAIFFFFQGIAITDHFLTKKNVLLFFRIIIYISVFMIPPAIAFLVMLGIFDPWFDFRKLDNHEKEI